MQGLSRLARCKGPLEVALELNTKGRYAVMAMADLAKHDGADPVPLSAVAERQHISLAYLEQLFLRLRRAGLVNSERGRAGGYRLSRDAASITVAEVMAAVEEGTRMTRCAGELGTPCLPGERCLTHGLWDALGEHIGDFLAGVTLKDVLEGMPRRKAVMGAPMAARDAGGALGTTMR
jgi:Rrf2 family iron-sulfur cluster assembly transcriptional regulator